MWGNRISFLEAEIIFCLFLFFSHWKTLYVYDFPDRLGPFSINENDQFLKSGFHENNRISMVFFQDARLVSLNFQQALEKQEKEFENNSNQSFMRESIY